MQELAIQLKSELNKSRKVVITTHRGPDGDALGSSLCLYHLLTSLEHSVHIITPNDYPEFLHWMPGNDNVIEYTKSPEKAKKITEEAELIVMLDFNNTSRLDKYESCVVESSAKKILIDHHQNPDHNCADIVISNSKASSTCELLYELLEEMQYVKNIDKDMADCLYVGIMTDTGSFKYSSTSYRTHEIISELIKKGAENSKIHDRVYDSITADRMKLLGYCLNEKLQLYTDNNSAIISLNKKELEQFNFKKGDTEGIVNYALAINNIIFAAFIVEREEAVKLSLRSKGNFRVDKIANEYFNGGGHMNAAGGVSNLPLDKTIKLVEGIIEIKSKELKQ